MALILNLETSTEVCSVALARDGMVISVREDHDGRNHAMLLTGFVEEVMQESGMTLQQLDAVAVSGGPGSYTGLRIGVSTAKGLCYALKVPLIALNSLESMIQQVMASDKSSMGIQPEQILYCPMIDARRMEVYSALFDHQGLMVRPVQADILEENSYESFLGEHHLLFFGNGSAKGNGIITHSNGHFIPDIYASAKSMAPLANRSFKAQQFVDVAYYEPFYLKDFVATTPTKNILNLPVVG